MPKKLRVDLDNSNRPNKSTKSSKSNKTNKFEEYMQASVECLNFSGSVLVARKGKEIFRAGYGKADREHDVTNSSATVFRLASITKQFTAMAIMILIDQGKLKLTDKISSFVSKAPEKWKLITIHQLLCHTSGITSYTDLPDFDKTKRDPASLEDMIDRVRKLPLKFSPGSKTDYTNSGYILLGYVIEKVSGLTYEQFLAKAIFETLAMKSTGYDHSERIIENRARGYAQSGRKDFFNAPYIDMNLPHAAGALYSTVEDLAIWDQALSSCKLISRKLSDIMFHPVKDGFACGWMIDEVDGRKRIQHAGGIDGFTTMIVRYPEEDAFITVLSNLQSAYFSAPSVAAGLAAILLGDAYEVPHVRKKIKQDPKISAAYVGKYRLSPDMTFDIKLEKSKLFVEGIGEKTIEIFAESETEYFIDEFDAQISFCKTGKKVSYLLLHQGGSTSKAKRVGLEA